MDMMIVKDNAQQCRQRCNESSSQRSVLIVHMDSARPAMFSKSRRKHCGRLYNALIKKITVSTTTDLITVMTIMYFINPESPQK